MSTWTKTRLAATSETGRPTAVASTTDARDLRPMRTGVRNPRLRGSAAEAAQATALIAALKMGDRA